jgi:tetratricopeptide (TPR) repeat protein
MLSPSELLDRLSERLDLLQAGRDVEPRQQTIRATIQWSYDLLSSDDQRSIRRLAVFAGGWTIPAAAAIDVDVDALQSLFDKSLLRRSGDGRFFMLETIREFARERLEGEAELEEVRRRHGEYMLACGRDALAEVDRWAGARMLEPDRENLRTALTWALETGQSRTGLLLATAYSVLCVYRGPLGEGRSWLGAALDAPGEQPPAERASALLSAAALAERQRELEPARELAEAGLQLARSIDASAEVIRALVMLGVTSANQHDFAEAESLLREAIELAEREGNERLVRESLSMLGWVALAQRDYTEARRVITKGLELSRAANDARGVFYATGNLGHVAARQGRYQEALPLLREALVVGLHQDLQSEADGLQELSAVAVALRHYEQGAVLLGAAESLLEGAEAVQEEIARGLRDETLSMLQNNLTDGEFAAAWKRGQGMTLEQAVAHALEFVDAVTAPVDGL